MRCNDRLTIVELIKTEFLLKRRMEMHSGHPEAAVILIIVLALVFVALLMTAVMIFMVWRVVSKTGFPGALSLLYIVPFGNIVILAILAFSEWPIAKELKAYKHSAGKLV